VDVIPSVLVGLAWSAAGQVTIPADPWPLREALEELATMVPADSTLAAAVARWPSSGSPMMGRFGAVRPILRQLAAGAHVAPVGRGRTAGWAPTDRFLAVHRRLAGQLNAAEQAAVTSAAQRLVASATTWSNSTRTAGASGAAASMSLTTR